MAPSTSREPRGPSGRAGRPARVASSSAVATATVANRQCSTSSSPWNIPMWVWVLPTSIASSTARSLRPQRRAHRVEAAVHVQDLARDPACRGRTGGSRRRRPPGAGSAVSQPSGAWFSQRPASVSKPGMPCGRRRLHRPGRDEVHAHALRRRGRGPGSGAPTRAPPSPRPSSRRPATPSRRRSPCPRGCRRRPSAARAPRPAP